MSNKPEYFNVVVHNFSGFTANAADPETSTAAAVAAGVAAAAVVAAAGGWWVLGGGS